MKYDFQSKHRRDLNKGDVNDMGFSITIKGVKTPTEDYLKKVRAYKALKDANIDIPLELKKYFDGNEPDESGMLVNINYTGNLLEDDCILEIDLNDIPDGVTKIRIIGDY